MTENSRPKIAAILLAAGASTRLGQPKQLLNFQGKTLLRRAAETLINSECSPIVVILGAEIAGSTAELSGLPVHFCINKDWANGMSSSIKTGLDQIQETAPAIDGVVIALCDQPNISAADIDALINAFDTDDPQIVTAEYQGTVGVPALFPQRFFENLLGLTGDKGARSLIQVESENVVTIRMESAAFDVDTAGDAEELKARL